MPEATLSVSLASDAPLGATAREHDATLAIRGASPRPSGATPLLVEVRDAADPRVVVETLCTHERTRSGDELRTADGRTLAHCRAAVPALEPLAEADAAFVPPFVATGTTGKLTVRTTGDRLSALRERLADSPVRFEVERVRSEVPRDAPLSDRQERVLEAALNAGYYDLPRSASVADVAEVERLTKSSVAETLRRAERTLAERYVE